MGTDVASKALKPPMSLRALYPLRGQEWLSLCRDSSMLWWNGRPLVRLISWIRLYARFYENFISNFQRQRTARINSISLVQRERHGHTRRNYDYDRLRSNLLHNYMNSVSTGYHVQPM